jgi:hypothetical protein
MRQVTPHCTERTAVQVYCRWHRTHTLPAWTLRRPQGMSRRPHKGDDMRNGGGIGVIFLYQARIKMTVTLKVTVIYIKDHSRGPDMSLFAIINHIPHADMGHNGSAIREDMSGIFVNNLIPSPAGNPQGAHLHCTKRSAVQVSQRDKSSRREIKTIRVRSILGGVRTPAPRQGEDVSMVTRYLSMYYTTIII